ncbi:MAG: pepsin-like aspartic protease [Acidobacteriota bacterium]
MRLAALLAVLLLVVGCQPTDDEDLATDTPEPTSTTVTTSHDLSHTGITRDLDGTPVAGQYTMKLEVGTPAKSFDVIMDSGSSNLILLGDASRCETCQDIPGQTYDPDESSTSSLNGKSFSIRYGSGELKADEVEDVVAVPGVEGFSYTFGVMTQEAGISNILGLAYQPLAQPNGLLPTFFATLVDQAGIDNVFAMTLCGANKGGKIELGHTTTEPTTYLPLAGETYYVVKPDHLALASTGETIGSFASVLTVVDSGTTELIVPQAMFDGIVSAIETSGTELDKRSDSEIVIKGRPDYDSLPTFQVVAGDVSLDIAPETYVKKLGLTEHFLAIAAQERGILGQVFIENHYTVFDRANKRMGFAPIAGLCD